MLYSEVIMGLKMLMLGLNRGSLFSTFCEMLSRISLSILPRRVITNSRWSSSLQNMGSVDHGFESDR
jgi:hypothetical protein